MFTAYGVPAFVAPPPFAPFACGHASRGNDQHLLWRLCPAESMVTGGADLGSAPSGIPSVSPCSTPCHGELEVESAIGVAGSDAGGNRVGPVVTARVAARVSTVCRESAS